MIQKNGITLFVFISQRQERKVEVEEGCSQEDDEHFPLMLFSKSVLISLRWARKEGIFVSHVGVVSLCLPLKQQSMVLA